jgi:DNA-binding PadR family transcriptional regulator
VIKTISDPIPVRGGRSKNYYRITSTGIDALQNAAKLKKIIWNQETEEALEKA